MSEEKNIFHYITKSGFVRSVFFRILSIFIVISIIISAIGFYSFASEIQKSILSDRMKQLSLIEETISERMDEITSIAYNISTDKAFYLEPVEGDAYSSLEMTDTLERYLVGNSFIEHLAYYRIIEPDTLYISNGTRSFTEFFTTSFGMSKEAAEGIINEIRNVNRTEVKTISYGKGITFFSYLYPLPQLSEKPKAYVLALIPSKQVSALLEPLVGDSNSEVIVLDSGGNEIFRSGELGEDVPLTDYIENESGEQRIKSASGTDYIMQTVVSESNGWSYISLIRRSETLSGFASRQLAFVAVVLVVEFIAIVTMLAAVIAQFKPISKLAETFAEKSSGGETGEIIDERVFLSNKLATLSDDSEQKQIFEEAYHEAEAANKAKSAFLSNMSHDIRTPMNAVIGMTAIALRHADEPDYVRECLKKVQVSSQYLLEIINNVLDMSRIESGRFTLTEDTIDLRVLIDGLVSIVGPSAAAKSQNLSVDIGEIKNPEVIGDNVKLTQVFVNILSNSVKFTPEGGTLSLSLRQTESDDPSFGNYVFMFSDNGVGMAPEFVGKVFDTFTRGEGMDISKIEGTGLGMAIAKNLIELMGGTISCESELGKGTTFTVNTHMKLAEEGTYEGKGRIHSAKSENGEIIDLSGKKILIVEDNMINREIAKTIIRETKAEVYEAQNGAEAFGLFEEKPEGFFDIILMDLQMPVMNGYEATHKIRTSDKKDALSVPIYAMTANTFDEDVRRVNDAGMNGHIGKPYTPEALYSVLGGALLK